MKYLIVLIFLFIGCSEKKKQDDVVTYKVHPIIYNDSTVSYVVDSPILYVGNTPELRKIIHDTIYIDTCGWKAAFTLDVDSSGNIINARPNSTITISK